MTFFTKILSYIGIFGIPVGATPSTAREYRDQKRVTKAMWKDLILTTADKGLTISELGVKINLNPEVIKDMLEKTIGFLIKDSRDPNLNYNVVISIVASELKTCRRESRTSLVYTRVDGTVVWFRCSRVLYAILTATDKETS